MRPTRLLTFTSVAYVVALFLPWKRYCAVESCQTTIGWASGFPDLLVWGGVAALGVIAALDLSRRSTPLWGRGAGYFAIAVGIFTGANIEGMLVYERREAQLLTWTAYGATALGGAVGVLGIVVLAGGWRETGAAMSKAIRKLRTWRYQSRL